MQSVQKTIVSQMKSYVLASSHSKYLYLVTNKKIQTFRDIKIFFSTAELQRWSQDTAANPDIVAALQLWLTSEASPTEIKDANWCQQHHRVLPTTNKMHRPKAVSVTHWQSFSTTFCSNVPLFHLVYVWCFTFFTADNIAVLQGIDIITFL